MAVLTFPLLVPGAAPPPTATRSLPWRGLDRMAPNLHPDHSAIARFLGRHEHPVKGLLVASVVECAREGLVSVDVVAGDGTKVKANASMGANDTLEELDLDIGEMEQVVAAEVDAWIAQAAAADAAQDALFGHRSDGDAGPGAGGPALAAWRYSWAFGAYRRSDFLLFIGLS